MLEDADKRFQLTQRERITLGLLAQNEGLTARELSIRLEPGDDASLKSWLGRLLDVGLVGTIGRAYTGQPYYAMRVTVLRDWLVDVVKLVTDPKP